MDFRDRLAHGDIARIQREVGLSSYPYLHELLSGKREMKSVDLAKRIAIASRGAIHWTDFFEQEHEVAS